MGRRCPGIFSTVSAICLGHTVHRSEGTAFLTGRVVIPMIQKSIGVSFGQGTNPKISLSIAWVWV